jgi:glycosyltransferase involved in cell wall biosynthesis
MEGLGFMVLEPICCGLPVITTDAKPMREYVTQPQMLVRKRLFKRKSFACNAGSIKHAYLTSPSISSLAKAIRWCSHNDLSRISEQNHAFGKTRHSPQNLIREWEAAFKQLQMKRTKTTVAR